MNPDIKGIISDMDGVILDTEKLYVRFWWKGGFRTSSFRHCPKHIFRYADGHLETFCKLLPQARRTVS